MIVLFVFLVTLWCIAMYDYEATCNEELTFLEGQIIKIRKRTLHDVDDGWWEGEMDGKIGQFPSLVVEECRKNGQPLTPEVSFKYNFFILKLIFMNLGISYVISLHNAATPHSHPVPEV